MLLKLMLNSSLSQKEGQSEFRLSLWGVNGFCFGTDSTQMIILHTNRNPIIVWLLSHFRVQCLVNRCDSLPPSPHWFPPPPGTSSLSVSSNTRCVWCKNTLIIQITPHPSQWHSSKRQSHSNLWFYCRRPRRWWRGERRAWWLRLLVNVVVDEMNSAFSLSVAPGSRYARLTEKISVAWVETINHKLLLQSLLTVVKAIETLSKP